MKPPYILIVDDDRDLRETLDEVLRDEGYSVRGVANGEEALELLRRSPPPCLILLDLMMPVMNGWQFRSAQLADPKLADIPVCVISAAAVGGIPSAQCHLNKPVELEQLLQVIAVHCRK